MRTKNRYWLITIIAIVIAAFWMVFRPIRMVRAEEEYTKVYYECTYEKALPASHSERAQKRFCDKVQGWLEENDAGVRMFGLRVMMPIPNGVKVRVDVAEREQIPDIEAAIRQTLAQHLGNQYGELRIDVTHSFPPQPVLKVGPVGIFKPVPNLKQGLDLQGGTHLVLQVRKENVEFEYQLAETPEQVIPVLEKLEKAGLPQTGSQRAAPEAPTRPEEGKAILPSEKPAKGASTDAGKALSTDKKAPPPAASAGAPKEKPTPPPAKASAPQPGPSASERSAPSAPVKGAGKTKAESPPSAEAPVPIEATAEEEGTAPDPEQKTKGSEPAKAPPTGAKEPAKKSAPDEEPPAEEVEEEPTEAERTLENLEELSERVEEVVRRLLEAEGLNVADEFPFQVVGANIVTVRTRARDEEELQARNQRVRMALRRGFPKAEERREPQRLVIPDDVVDQVQKIVDLRINKFGVAEPVIQKQGEDRIVVELPGIKDPEEVIEKLGTTAQLEFRKIPEKYQPQVEHDAVTQTKTTYFVDKDGQEVPTDVVYFESEAIMKGTALKPGSATVGFDQYGSPDVNLELTREGSRTFDEFAAKNYHKYLGIFLDREVISAPRMEARKFGGKVRISGGFESVEEAKDLKVLLNAGALPVPVRVVEQRTVSATLGADSVRQSFQAGLIGLILVVLLMVSYYRLPGVLASVALLIFSLLLLAAMVLLRATLTLPGIFGIILSIGMAVDANVLIFERLREELRAGKTLRSAIQAGFERAWSAILDGNVTTLLMAAVLYIWGTGPIRGFAVTLFIGNVASLFTAVTVTRVFMNVVAETKLGNRREMYGV